MNILKFEQFRRENQKFLGTSIQGEEDFPKFDRLIRGMPENSTILLDISGFELFGYSYSKQTVRAAMLLAKGNMYGDRFLAVKSPNKKYAEELSVALSEEKLAMLCTLAKNPSNFFEQYVVLGALSEPQRSTLDFVIKSKSVTSRDLQKEFDISISAASNRLNELAEARLVRWENLPDRQYNVRVCRRVEV